MVAPIAGIQVYCVALRVTAYREVVSVPLSSVPSAFSRDQSFRRSSPQRRAGAASTQTMAAKGLSGGMDLMRGGNSASESVCVRSWDLAAFSGDSL